MKRNKRGFTLVELLAVIVILVILILLVVPTVLKILKDYRYKTYLRQKEILVNATEKYLVQNENEIIWNNGEAEIFLEDLQAKKVIGNKVNNSITNDNFSKKTRITATKTESGIYYRVSEEAELTYQFTKEKAGEEGTFEYYNGSNRYRGSNPNNWLRFGQDSEGNNLMWRVVRWDEDGIKIIYEGKENNGEAPIDDGRIKIDGEFDVVWNKVRLGMPWDNVTLKKKLATWYNNLNINKDYIQPVNWCVNALTMPIPLNMHIRECKIKTQKPAGYGLITYSEHENAKTENSSRIRDVDNADELISHKKQDNNFEINDFLIAMVDNKNRVNTHLISRAGDDAAGGNLNPNHYLRKSYSWWTLTTYFETSTKVIVSGKAEILDVGLANPNDIHSVRPVLNLKSSVYGCGEGTLANPYQPTLQKVLCLMQ